MTAAPGPQQPDEVRAEFERRLLVWLDAHSDDTQTDLLASALTGALLDDGLAAFLPAAPSAQPDDRRQRLVGAIEMWASDYAPQIADYILTRFPDLNLGTPAQPARNTEEGL